MTREYYNLHEYGILSARIRRSAQDQMWSASFEIEKHGAPPYMKPVQYVYKNRCLFTGIIPYGIRKYGGAENRRTLDGYSWEWYLSRQQIPFDMLLDTPDKVDNPPNPAYNIRMIACGDDWILMANQGIDFSARAYFGFEYLNGYFYFFGGYDGANHHNDVWRSADGLAWELIAPDTDDASRWAKRRTFAHCVYDGKLWVLGGWNGVTWTRYNDVWYSSDGITWTKASGTPPFSARNGLRVAVNGDTMIVMGGRDSGGLKQDVYTSTNPAAGTWTTQPLAGWRAREDFAAAALGGAVFVIGGDDGTAELSDVWKTEDYATWIKVAELKFPPRSNFNCAVFNGRIWISHGIADFGFLRDTWSSRDGVTWMQELSTEQVRYGHGLAASPTRLMVIGGITGAPGAATYLQRVSYRDDTIGTLPVSGIYPGNIVEVALWGTEDLPAKPFQFDTKARKIDAINEQCSYADYVFLVKPVLDEGSGWWKPSAYFVPYSDIDAGLNLPAPLTITRGRTDQGLAKGYEIRDNPGDNYNYVLLRGVDEETGLWLQGLKRDDTVATGEALAIEYYDELAQITDTESLIAMRGSLYDYFRLSASTYMFTFIERPDLELYQKLKFAGFPDIPEEWLRIVDIEYAIDQTGERTTVACGTDQSVANKRILARLHADTWITQAERLEGKILTSVAKNQEATVVSISPDGRWATLKLAIDGRYVRARVLTA